MVLGLSGGLSDDRFGTLSGRRVEDRVVVVARAALATHVVEEQLAELERHADGHRGQETNNQQTTRPLVPVSRNENGPDERGRAEDRRHARGVWSED